jgi:GntR family transcriptional regulator
MTPLFRLNPDDPLPLYAQLERAIRLAVTTGALKVGDQLPTVRQLAVDLKVNANTVAKVYAELERQGLLATRRGVGTFIQANPAAPPVASKGKRFEELAALAERFLAEAAARGFAAEDIVEQMQRLGSQSKEKSHGRR